MPTFGHTRTGRKKVLKSAKTKKQKMPLFSRIANGFYNERWMLLTFVGLSLLAAGLFMIIGRRELIGDEWAHFKQAQDLQKTITVFAPFTPVHPTIPGYHALLSLLGLLVGTDTLWFFRGVTLMFNVLSTITAYGIARKLGLTRNESLMKMAQYFFIPILFPFHFLLYTDVVSVFATLLLIHATLSRRYVSAGMLGIVTILVRQNNVLWLPVAMLLIVVQEWRPLSFRAVLRYIRHTWMFFVAFAGLAGFIVWNGGIAMADEGAHPPFAVHMGNPYFFLVQFLIMFLPLCVVLYPRILRMITGHPKFAAGTGFGAFLVYMMSFFNTHPYNFDAFWLRNKIVLFFTKSPVYKALYFPVAAYSFLCLCLTPLIKRRLYVFYGASFLYLAASWLIEPRYAFTPFALLVLFRRPQQRWLEWTLLGWFVLLSGVLWYGAWKGTWLP